MSREQLEKQLAQSGKTSEQAFQESFDYTRNLIAQEKTQEEQQMKSKLGFFRTIANMTKPSNKKILK